MVVLFAVWTSAVVCFRSKFAPEAHVRTFDDLKRQGVPMTRAVSLPSGTGEVCVYGDVKPLLWTLPSGPPAYHFDATGKLVDFTLDVGDSTLFQRDYDVDRGTEIPLTELPGLFTKQKP